MFNWCSIYFQLMFNWCSIYFQLMFNWFQLISIDAQLISIDVQLISIYFQLMFNWFQLVFNWFSIDFNWFSIDFNWNMFNWFQLKYVQLISIYFQLISIDFQLISIYFQLYQSYYILWIYILCNILYFSYSFIIYIYMCVCVAYVVGLSASCSSKGSTKSLPKSFLHDASIIVPWGVPSKEANATWAHQRGALWAAQRVPSGHVAVVANSHLLESGWVGWQKMGESICQACGQVWVWHLLWASVDLRHDHSRGRCPWQGEFHGSSWIGGLAQGHRSGCSEHSVLFDMPRLEVSEHKGNSKQCSSWKTVLLSRSLK